MLLGVSESVLDVELVGAAEGDGDGVSEGVGVADAVAVTVGV